MWLKMSKKCILTKKYCKKLLTNELKYGIIIYRVFVFQTEGRETAWLKLKLKKASLLTAHFVVLSVSAQEAAFLPSFVRENTMKSPV